MEKLIRKIWKEVLFYLFIIGLLMCLNARFNYLNDTADSQQVVYEEKLIAFK